MASVYSIKIFFVQLCDYFYVPGLCLCVVSAFVNENSMLAVSIRINRSFSV